MALDRKKSGAVVAVPVSIHSRVVEPNEDSGAWSLRTFLARQDTMSPRLPCVSIPSAVLRRHQGIWNLGSPNGS